MATADRKLRLLQRAGLFGDDTKGATIRRACTVEELRQAYRLVHDVFLETGFLRPQPSGLRLRIFETTSETATFIAEKDGAVVGVISVVGDSRDLGLPSDPPFRPELAARRAAGQRLCELTNQAVAEGYRKSAVPTELMRCAVAHALQAGYHEAIATVSPSHRGFYELLGFHSLGSERSYSDKLHDPVVALRLNFDELRAPAPELTGAARFIRGFATERNRYLAQVADWAKQARRQFLNAFLLEQLFVHERNFVAECTPEELEILRRRWGEEMFQVVTGITDLADLGPPAAPPLAGGTDPGRRRIRPRGPARPPPALPETAAAADRARRRRRDRRVGVSASRPDRRAGPIRVGRARGRLSLAPPGLPPPYHGSRYWNLRS